MKADIQNAFSQIQADDELIAKTADYLQLNRAKHKNKRRHSLRSRGIAFSSCAAVLCLVVALFSHRLYYTADIFVSVDVNPSIELSINRLERVIGTHAYNVNGEILLKNLDIRGKKYGTALDAIVSEIGREGYIVEEALVLVTVQTANTEKENELCQSLRLIIDKSLQVYSSAPTVEVSPVTKEIRSHAHSHNISPAKYMAIQELMKIDDIATIEQYSSRSIGQIRQRMQQCLNQHGDAQSVPHGNGVYENNRPKHGRHGHH